MAALTAYRNTPKYGPDSPGIPDVLQLGVAANTTIFGGGIVALNITTGFIQPAAAGAGLANQLVCIGKAEPLTGTSVNNPGAAGAITCGVRQGVHKWANSAGVDAISSLHIGQVCYAQDDNTVAATSNLGVRPFAGYVVQVDTDGVWVEMMVTLGGKTSSGIDLILPTGADLSASVGLFVSLDSTGRLIVCPAGDVPIGVLLANPAAGAGVPAMVRIYGIAQVLAGAAPPAQGARVAADAAGRAKAAVLGSGAGSDVAGIALSTAATGVYMAVLLQNWGALASTPT